ncbi:MAG: RNA-guided endonuclease TnpB family protein [Acidimicrobiales bacterium]
MSRFKVPQGWCAQAYKFCLDDGQRAGALEASWLGAKLFAKKWGLGLVEDQFHATNTNRALALRQGASTKDTDKWAKTMVPVPWSQAAMRHLRNDEKDLITARDDAERKTAVGNIHAREVLEFLALRQGAHRTEARNYADRVVPTVGWWKENSKEAYSSGFEVAALALKNYFDSKNGVRKGPPVGWPKPKRNHRGRQSVGFTIGRIAILDRHHVRLPVISVRGRKAPTDKLRPRIEDGSAKILRATLCEHGHQRFISFNVILKRENRIPATCGVCGTDVGIAHLAAFSDGYVVENPRAERQVRQTINRYQRRMDRRHRTASPACFNPEGTHIGGRCFWNVRSKDTQAKLRRAHAKAANVRRHAIHDESHRLGSTYSVNVLEDPNVSAMMRKGRAKRGYSRPQGDSALAELRRQLSYKHAWFGGILLLANRWYPSSKTCSFCKVVNHNLERSQRVFECPKCGLVIGRDPNTAYNLQSLLELARVAVFLQLSTGEQVEGSKLPVRPYGSEKEDGKNQGTCSSRGCARARGPRANGRGRETARRSSVGDHPFDREAAVATGFVGVLDGVSPSPKKALS